MKNKIVFTFSLLLCLFATEQLSANSLARFGVKFASREGRRLLLWMGAATGSIAASASTMYAKYTMYDSARTMEKLTQEMNGLTEQSVNISKAHANKADSGLSFYLNNMHIDVCMDKVLREKHAATKRVSRWMRILPDYYQSDFVEKKTVFKKAFRSLVDQKKKSREFLDTMTFTGKDLRVIEDFWDLKQPNNMIPRPFQGINLQVLKNGVSDLWKRTKTEFKAVVAVSQAAGPMLFVAGR